MLISFRRAMAVLFSLLVLVCAINLPLLIYYHITDTGLCSMLLKYKPVILFIYIYWSDVILSILIPLFVIICGNVIIITKLTRAQATKSEMGATGGKDSRGVTVMLVSVGIAFILTMFPSAIYWLGASTDIWPNTTTEDKNNKSFAFAIMMILLYTNSSINFILYCLAGTRFRQAFIGIIFCQDTPVKGIQAFTLKTNTNLTKSTTRSRDHELSA